MSTECPNCRSTGDHKIIWGPRNLRAVLVNVLNAGVLLRFWPFISYERIVTPARPLRRKCLKCGFRFRGDHPETPDFDECAQCGYSLKGNLSGRCPECGWRLPRRFRAYRRLADRELGNRSA